MCEFLCSGSSRLYFTAKDSAPEYVANKITEALADDDVGVDVLPCADFEALYDIYGREFVNRIGIVL